MPTIVFRPAAQIFTGLAILGVAMIFPGAPPCVGMALVALGATATTIERYASSTARTPLLLAHALVYVAIYLLFVGATLDAASRTATGLPLQTMLDIAVSLLLMTALAGSIVTALRYSLSTKH